LKLGLNRLGRSSQNDFQIDNPTVSRFHAEVILGDEWMFVRDTDSSNGVFVNGRQVLECSLESGQILRLGSVSLEVKDAPVLGPGRELVTCENHLEVGTTFVCKQCRREYRGSHLHIVRNVGGRILFPCPVCSGYCEPLDCSNQDTNSWFNHLVRRLFDRSKTVSVLPARMAPGGSPVRIISCPSCAEQIVIPAEAAEDPAASTLTWQQRALAAERRAERAHEAIRAGVLPQFADWLKQRFIRGLVSDRVQMLEAQKSAAAELAELERRLDELHTPLQERLRAYERRIAELEKLLAARGEETRELLKAKIQMTRRQLETTRSRNPLEFN